MRGRIDRTAAVKVAMARLGVVEEPWKEADLEAQAEMSVLATSPLSVELVEVLRAAASSGEVGLWIVLGVIGKLEELWA